MSLREKKTALKKREIIESALTVLAEKGYHGTTMEEIAAHLLMTKGSVYYYFKDKQHLVYESQIMLLEQIIENMSIIKSKTLTTIEKLTKSCTIHVEYVLAERAGFELMSNPKDIFLDSQINEINKLKDTYAQHYDALLQDGIAEGIFQIDDVKLVRNLVLGAMNWATQWYAEDGKQSKEDLAKEVTTYLLRIVRG